MPSASGFRALVSLSCLVVGLIGSVILYRTIRARQQDEEGIVMLEPEPDHDQPESELRWIQNFPQSTLKRFELTEERARSLLPQLKHRWSRFDPVMYFGYQPNLHARVKLEAHPDGVYWVTTNSLGMRRDGEIASQKPDLRILVAGDSHADGVCNNSEAFPALLESALEEDRQGQVVEVLNACRGGQSPFSYLGTLEKFSYLEPDVFVLWFTGSNDFMDPLLLCKIFRGDSVAGLPEEIETSRRRALKVSPPVYSSGLHSASYFLSRPSQVQYVHDLCRDILSEILLICERDGIQVQIIYLPPPIFMPWQAPWPEADEMIEILGFTREALAQQAASMGDSFMQLCGELGVPVLDLGPHLSHVADANFYRRDLHLNVSGHRVVGAALMDALAPVLGK